MGVKTIIVGDEVYKLLLGMKKEEESFNDVLLRVIGKRAEKKTSPMDFFGVLKDSENLEEL